MWALLSFLPGIGPIAGVVATVANFIWSCRPCLFALAGIAIFIAGDIRGTRRANEHCREADVAAQLAATQRDLGIKAVTAEFVQNQADKLAAENDELKKKVDQYEADRAKTAIDKRCRLTIDDLKRLRDIR